MHGTTRNIAARAGRWSARHRKTAILGWLAFVIAATVLGGAIGTNTLKQEDYGIGESGRADDSVQGAFPDSSDETLLVQSEHLDASAPAFKAAVADAMRAVSAQPGVRDVRGPYEHREQVSDDGRSALVNFAIAGDSERAEKGIGAVLAAVDRVDRRHDELSVGQFGAASASMALSEAFEDDFRNAEVTSLPITLAILVIAFGAFVAAGIPLLLAATAVAAAIGLIAPISQLFAVDPAINSVVLLIGLAVGVDYAMFYLRREREERAAGRSEEAALEAAAATSGRAVLISGLTVMLAMAGMFFGGAATWTAFAVGTMLVVAIAVVGSLTVLPALLSKLGDRVEKGRVPWIGRLKRSGGESRVWGALIDRVLRRPLVSALAATALLVALAVPALGLHTALPSFDTLPRDVAVMQTYDRIQAEFPGNQLPADVVVEAEDVTAPEVQAAIGQLTDQALATDGFGPPPSVEVSPDETVAIVSLPIAGDGTDDASNAALTQLREEIVPATVGGLDGASVGVTGITAGTEDFNQLMKSNVVWVFAFVLGAAFLLLLVTFRSLVIPIKAIALNLLSVGAAYGLLVLVFQEGWGESLLGFESTGAITSWLPLFLFVILFGLSMDYHVFILTRIREAFDRGMSTEDAVAHGIKSTAGVVTSAAAVMIAVFAIFGSLSMIEFKQMGVGLAAAVLIDATLIRGVLLPATMKLLGDWNWWLPDSLQWLPRVAHEPEAEPARA